MGFRSRAAEADRGRAGEADRRGGSKAKFFINCGFDINNWKIFADALCEQAQNHSILEVEETPYGTKYMIKGVLQTPSNKNVLIRTVWITKNQREETELITAYPV